MIDLFKMVVWYTTWYTIEGTCTVLFYILKYIPGAQVMINEEMRREPILLILFYMLKYIPGAQDMINEEVRRDTILVMSVSDDFKKQEMCEEAVEAYP